MKYGLSDHVKESITKVIAKHDRVTSAVLYGSRAKGSFSTGSDIDLALTGDLTFSDILTIKTQFEELDLPYEIDVCHFETLSNQDLVDHIKRVGSVFFKREE